jgi:hypothetical protein
MARFMVYCLKNNVEIGDIYAFAAPGHRNSTVVVTVRLLPEQALDFEVLTGGTLREPRAPR